MQEFFTGLFDLTFRKLITPKLAKLVYVIAIVGAGFGALVTLKASANFLGLISAIVFFITSVVAARVLIEVALSVFQIARYTGEIARRGRSEDSAEARLAGHDDDL